MASPDSFEMVLLCRSSSDLRRFNLLESFDKREPSVLLRLSSVERRLLGRSLPIIPSTDVRRPEPSRSGEVLGSDAAESLSFFLRLIRSFESFPPGDGESACSAVDMADRSMIKEAWQVRVTQS